jgi:HTH-type transcriptional regulator, quorum sensing regulator NprR
MIGDKIKFYRKKRGLTQAILAEGICSIPYLSKIEQGKTECSEEIVTLLSQRLNIPLEDRGEETEVEIDQTLESFRELVQSNSLKEAEVLYKKVKEEVIDRHSPNLQVKYHLISLLYYLYLKDLTKAEYHLEIIDKVSEELPTRHEFDYHKHKALYLLNKQEYANSLLHYEKALEILDRVSDMPNLVKADLFYQIAIVYVYLYKLALSNQFAKKALELFHKEYEFKRVVKCLILLGVNYGRVNNFLEAVDCYERALKVAKSINDSHSLCIIHHNLGSIYSAQQERTKAIEQLMLSLSLDGLRTVEKIQTYYLLAKEHTELEEHEKAQNWIEKGKKLLTNKSHQEYSMHFHLLELEIKRQFDETYEQLLIKAIEWFKGKQFWYYVTEFSEKLASYYHDDNKYKKASDFYRFANEARKKIL